MVRRLVVIVLTVLLISGASGAAAPAPVKLRVGIVAAIDQLGTPVAVDRGFFEKWGLDVTIANPFPTGVDLLNALQAGEIQMGQVGVPMIGAVLRGMDLVILGNYSGSSSKRGGDNTMAIVSRPGTNITSIRDLRGKRIAVSFGTISHLYILGVLERAKLAVGDVTLVNTPPGEMPEVLRGGGFIGFMGFIVATRQWAQQNQETVEKFLAARAEADQFMRANAVKTAEIAVRWLTAMRPEVALRGVRNNLPNLDIRISSYNYLALHNGMTTLNRLGFLPGVFDVNKVFMPGPMLNVMRSSP